MNIQAVIFDMDGTIVNTEHLWRQKEEELIFDQIGITPQDIGNKLHGVGLREGTKILQAINPKASIEQMYDLYNNVAKSVYQETTLFPGVPPLLTALQKENIPIYIGSASPLEWIHMMLDTFSLASYFSGLYSIESMNLPGKPDPKIFTLIMEEHNLDPNHTIVIEDSPRGISAAKQSGAITIGVPEEKTDKQALPEIDLLTESLSHVTIDTLQNLVNKRVSNKRK